MAARLRLTLLAAIVAIYLFFGFAYAVKTPTWEMPDEPAHFNYVRHLAERFQFPVLQVGDYDQAYLEKLKASRFPPAMSVESIRYESWQPPLYYLLSTPLYWASGGLPLFQQVIVLRLFSVLLGGILLLVSYATVWRIFPEDDLLSLAVPGFIAVLPQHIAISAAVSNDTLAEVIMALILFVLVRRLFVPSPFAKGEGADGRSATRFESTARRLWSAKEECITSVVTLGLLLGAALLTKSTIYIGLVLIPLGLLLREFGLRGQGLLSEALRTLWLLRAVRESAVVFAVAFAVSGWWFVRNALVYGQFDLLVWKRHDLVVQGQPLTDSFNFAYAKFFVLTSFRSFWAQFGWMGVLADDRTYSLLGALTAVAAAGLGLFLLRIARQPGSLSSIQGPSLLLMGATLVLVLGVLVSYNFRFIQAQGRYLFPALIPIAIFFTLGLREIVAPRYAALIFSLLYLALLALDYFALTRFILPQLAG